MLTIVQEGNPVLRTRAEEVLLSDITTVEIQTIIQEMNRTLAAERLGAALAAPQVGISKRIFVVSPDVVEKNQTAKSKKPLVCINPEILSRSKAREELHEGCLSLRGWWGYVLRSDKVTIRAYDEHGKEFERGASGLLAQIFQHEIDHLNGTLYIDHAHDMHTDEELKRREDAGTHGKTKKS
jgi:peptide deformylase